MVLTPNISDFVCKIIVTMTKSFASNSLTKPDCNLPHWNGCPITTHIPLGINISPIETEFSDLWGKKKHKLFFPNPTRIHSTSTHRIKTPSHLRLHILSSSSRIQTQTTANPPQHSIMIIIHIVTARPPSLLDQRTNDLQIFG